MKKLILILLLVQINHFTLDKGNIECSEALKMLRSEEFLNLSLVHQKMIIKRFNEPSESLSHHIQACWQPGTNMHDIMAFYENYSTTINNSLSDHMKNKGPKFYEFNDNNRWSNTATNGSGLNQGDPTTLTWSIVPDGTSIYGYNGEATSNSNLIAMLDGQYPTTPPFDPNDLTQRDWFKHFEDVFERWSQLTGNEYVYEPNDDGSAWTNVTIASGSLGVRGDIRISGHSIDGALGSNTLAYNFFPNFGDMVIDTDNFSFYGNPANNSLGLRNTLSHEHGHGLGISHSCPIEQVKLMEPFISFSFDGPQFDDILAANRGYGDSLEMNDNIGSASDLGTITQGTPFIQADVSIDDNEDDDFYKFTVLENSEVSITLTPSGTTYLAGSQNPNGSCSAGSNFNPLFESDLSMQLIATDGSTVITSANSQPSGSVETITSEDLPDGAGTYFVKVEGSDNSAQIYMLEISIVNTTVLGCTDPSAHNYNPSANTDDDTCETCTDNIQNGDETNVDCGGTKCTPCITGCTDPMACDYNPSANVAGSCDYSCIGCTDPLANNYDNMATKDDGMCTYDCNTSLVTQIDNTNVNSIVITSMNNLETVGTLNLTADTVRYQAKNSIEINENFTVNIGSLLSISVDSCH